MFIDPEMKPPRDERGRLLPDEPVSWILIPFTIVFVGGFWALIGLINWAFSTAVWGLSQKVGNVPAYQLVIGGMLLLTASLIFFRLRDVRKSNRVVLAQIVIGVTGGLYAISTASTFNGQIMSALAALVTIADGLKTINENRNNKAQPPIV